MIVAWCCFVSAICAPKWVGVPVVLNLFGIYELHAMVSLLTLFEYGYVSFLVIALVFLYIVVPVMMGVLFIYYSCIYLYAQKLKVITITKEEQQKINLRLLRKV